MSASKARRPILIEHVLPAVDAGRFPVKREVGDRLAVSADIVKEGHDRLAAVIRYRAAGEAEWRETPLEPHGNDAWSGAFPVTTMYTGRGFAATESRIDASTCRRTGSENGL